MIILNVSVFLPEVTRRRESLALSLSRGIAGMYTRRRFDRHVALSSKLSARSTVAEVTAALLRRDRPITYYTRFLFTAIGAPPTGLKRRCGH